MAEQPTCGNGLAEQAVLPAKLGELTASLAAVLEVHMTALDVTDLNAKAAVWRSQRRRRSRSSSGRRGRRPGLGGSP